ncbi:MAG: hypothetical protein OEY36_07915 [Gammaproteobacteria bacterium]|nr:hypothetical protein [Gammaproteobacteria bacterium]
MTTLQLSLMGAIETSANNQNIVLSYNKLQGLLAILAMSADKPLSRDMLADLFWPDMPEKNAKENLRRALYNLKSALGDASRLLISNKKTVSLESTGLSLDIDVIRHITTCSAELNIATSYGQLEKQIKLYRGEFMTGFTLPDSHYQIVPILKTGCSCSENYYSAICSARLNSLLIFMNKTVTTIKPCH